MNQERIRVVHYRYHFLGLTENWIYNQITGLGKVSIKVYAVNRKNKDSFPLNDLRCLREDLGYFPLLINLVWGKLFHRYPQFLLWLWKDRPNLIHSHFGPGGYDMLPFARRLHIPLVTSFYGYDAYRLPRNKPWWRYRYKKLFQQGRLFLVEGPVMREKLTGLGCPPKKVIVHRIGVTPGKYTFKVRRPEGEIRLMICGRFVEKKGMPYAIEALQRVRAETGKEVHLTVVGDSDRQGTLTDEKKKILRTIERCGVSGAVTITGYTPHEEVMRIAMDHHIYLAPSVHASDGDAEGGFPVILTEVLATGMPVVAFDHCDIPNVVQDGMSGFIVPERDVGALSEKIRYLIDHPDTWPWMGRHGREFVEENHDIEKLNRRLMAIYRSLVEGGEIDG